MVTFLEPCCWVQGCSENIRPYNWIAYTSDEFDMQVDEKAI